MSEKSSRRLPGDLTHGEEIERIIRVDHAGEYGAMRIYAGQLAVLKNDATATVISEMAEQEAEHLRAFEQFMKERKVRPTALMPLWHVAGYLLGAGTAMLGPKAAMACTVAVESVIDEHYEAQEKQLAGTEPELTGAIRRFREDEREHHDTGLAHGAEGAPAYAALRTAVESATKLAIWLSKRI